MPEQPERVITWGEVLPGDVIRGADGAEWTIDSRITIPQTTKADIYMHRQGEEQVYGTPGKNSVVTLLRGGSTRAFVATFLHAGLPAHYEGTEQS